jgi:hypothetical protein
LRQFPTTSVWFDPAHGVNALMCARSVSPDDAPYVKVLRHVRLPTISTHNGQ